MTSHPYLYQSYPSSGATEPPGGFPPSPPSPPSPSPSQTETTLRNHVSDSDSPSNMYCRSGPDRSPAPAPTYTPTPTYTPAPSSIYPISSIASAQDQRQRRLVTRAWLERVHDPRDVEGEAVAVALPAEGLRVEGSRIRTGARTGTGGYAVADGAWQVRSLVEEENWGRWVGNGNRNRTENEIGNRTGTEDEYGGHGRNWDGNGNGTGTGNRTENESGGHGGRDWDGRGEEDTMTGPRWGIATETETGSHGFEAHTRDEGLSTFTGRGEDGVSGSGSVARDGFGFCSRCGAPWDADDEQNPERLSANHGNHNDNSENPSWARTTVYGQEGLNRLRSLQTTTAWGNGISTSDQPGHQLQYTTPRTTVCGACGRDRQMECDRRNYWRGKREKKEDDDDDDEEGNWNGEKTIHVGYRNVRVSDGNSQGNNRWNGDGWGGNGWNNDGSKDDRWGNADPAASVAEETHQTSTQDEEQPNQGGWGVELRAEVAETSNHESTHTSVVSSSQHTNGTSTTNRNRNSESTIKDSFEYMQQWGGLKGFMNAFLINPERTDAVYQAGKLILSLRAQGASFTRPRRKFWDEELARVLAGDMFEDNP